MKHLPWTAGLALGAVFVTAAVAPVVAKPDTAYAERYSKAYHKSVFTGDYNHRYRFWHNKWPANAPRPAVHHTGRPDTDYAQRYSKAYHKSISTADYNHRYRYWHHKFPK